MHCNNYPLVRVQCSGLKNIDILKLIEILKNEGLHLNLIFRLSSYCKKKRRRKPMRAAGVKGQKTLQKYGFDVAEDGRPCEKSMKQCARVRKQ